MTACVMDEMHVLGNPWACLRLPRMEVDPPSPKRRRVDANGSWWEALPEDSTLWGLCDALSLYASSHGATPVELGHRCCGSPSSDDAAPITPQRQPLPAQPSTGRGLRRCRVGSSTSTGGTCGPFADGGNIGGNVPSAPRTATTAVGTTNAASSDAALPAPLATAEPLLRALTQLANAAAESTATRRQLVAQCQVHVPLLRLMQHPWAQQPLVIERCCRLLHWLCARAHENREAIASHRGACSGGNAQSVGFVDLVLGAAEAHPQRREVLAHAMRALHALLPCSRVRAEVLRCQPRLLRCLVLAWEVLDEVSVRAVCRWLPGISGQVRLARGRMAMAHDRNGLQAANVEAAAAVAAAAAAASIASTAPVPVLAVGRDHTSAPLAAASAVAASSVAPSSGAVVTEWAGGGDDDVQMMDV